MKARSPKLKSRSSPAKNRRRGGTSGSTSHSPVRPNRRGDGASTSNGISPTKKSRSATAGQRFQQQRKQEKKRRSSSSSRLILFTLVGFWFLAMVYMVSHLNALSSSRTQQDGGGASSVEAGTAKEEENSVPVDVHAAVHHQHSIHHATKKQDNLLEAAIHARQHRNDGMVESSSHLKKFESPLLIFTCHRAEYLKETMANVMKYIPSDCEIGCPIILSQDGTDEETTKLIQQMQAEHRGDIPILHLHHKQSSNTKQRQQFAGYYALANHYGWALEQVFSGQAYDENESQSDFPLPLRTILLEEDLRIAPDFFSYMKATAPLLDSDPTLLAVSAFNDNGKKGLVEDSRRILRSDFFPGLGWMMTRDLWKRELATKWPDAFWDDWLREPAQRQGRHILRPEVSRTFHFGSKGGASGNQYGGHLLEIELEEDVVDFSKFDLEYELKEETFNQEYWELVGEQSELVTADDHEDLITKAKEAAKEGNVRIEYTSQHQFARFARSLHLMDDEKAGIPRTAYKGIVETRPHGNHFLFLTPPLDKVKEDLGV
uniref:alpha-1,3-mannosyl-glycoprotein 2-beta-N-acetylglucosaminyltransferase n=1 Tax=Grammatophora oceanica TaxID=210454 RepID=A0A7S1UY43_9STRA|mmetsp:Transcript_29324/g.43239  ORF Transcript_29324/g.43239 Transcript_29324/m.43239 type:complete len:545 (+) Transcript_29324:560-2194(+)|eukprot:CAMPEP_0194059368 /NCGR_PEP_ID=MMETSP0009_2-20130614/68828_1 /TAXON_ID=210454 /ORGANISM="Grammatophora oceanica, Strain CCMP 410" /LENGTH=544 /DNA_ID=CAMNT_0038709901 /DNA_START=40 /DNA_END=1674 /DNA_ORIENTATION=+